MSVLVQLSLLFEWVQRLDQNQEDSQSNLHIKAITNAFSIMVASPRSAHGPQTITEKSPLFDLLNMFSFFSLISHAYPLTFGFFD